jgi:hypothetical protein
MENYTKLFLPKLYPLINDVYIILSSFDSP